MSFRPPLNFLSQEFLGQLRAPEEQVRRRLGIQIWAEGLSNDWLRALMRRGVDEARNLLAEMLRSAQQRRDFPMHVDPDTLARIMIVLFHGFILQQAWDEQLSVEPYIATIQALLQQSSSIDPQDQGCGHEPTNE